jgi:hypothetical protein
MEKQLEYFDVLANAQKQVLNNLLSTQEDMRTQWIDAIGKTRSAFTGIPGLTETAQSKEVMKHFNSWFSTVANSAQSATAEVKKTQENWISAYDKQAAFSRDVLKSFIAVATPAPVTAKLKAA